MAGAELYIGLMSGTSADSIDAAVADFSTMPPKLLATHSHPLPDNLKNQIIGLCQPGDNEIDRQGELDRQLGDLFSDATLALLKKTVFTPRDIAAIGSHGQTIRHRPPGSVDHPFSLQIGDPNTIAEKTGINTVADFRRRDIAAGGQGAPLAPAFHNALFYSPDKSRVLINIGGMANITFLPSKGKVIGFDTGPGNALMDAWIHRHLGENFDRDGLWAAQGNINQPLLTQLFTHPFFSQPAPKSTGRESFHIDWLMENLAAQKAQAGEQLAAVDIQATLLELTAQSIANDITRIATSENIEIFICGGGAHNDHLLVRLGKLLPGFRVTTTEALGLAPDWVEAIGFAWLARQTMHRLSGNLPAVTGAEREIILGGVYFAGSLERP